MRLILSRKGFDSSAGGIPSPIVGDELVPLPIPEARSTRRYGELSCGNHRLAAVIERLLPASRKHRAAAGWSPRSVGSHGAHVDPDLGQWGDHGRRLFGQDSAAQAHLARHGVGPGDLFLFFGWFRATDRSAGGFAPDAPDLHVIWGWMQAGAIWTAAQARANGLADHHPHLSSTGRYAENNTLYEAAAHLSVPGLEHLQGAGAFSTLTPARTLTEAGARRSRWTLPSFFRENGRPPLTYHAHPARWRRSASDGRWNVSSVGRGQEFVLDLTGREERANTWLRELFRGP